MPSRLEQYLDEISRPVSPGRRAEWREETRQHLEQLVASYKGLGMEPDAAVEAAVRTFGEAQRVGRAVEKETQGARGFLPRVAGPLFGLAAVALIAPVLYVFSLLLFWQGDAGRIAPSGLLALVWSLIAGPIIWARRTAPGRAAVINGGVYLVVSATIIVAACLRELPIIHQQGHSFPVNIVPNLVKRVAFVGLQGVLVGGTVAVAREWYERTTARWRAGKA